MPETAAGLREALVAGDLDPHAVLDRVLERAAAAEPELHAFLTLDEQYARRQIDELQARRAAGEAPGPLWGVPFSVKDTYDTAGLRTTYGSRVFAGHVPARDAELVRRVRAAGGILVGKTNAPEFAIHIRTANDLAPETRNPWDPGRTSGGSSGGAAASVGAQITPIAVGSDGGGSVRIPSALCGTVGLMPSRGAIPRAGGGIGTRRFSSAGPHALDAADAALLYSAMAGPYDADGLSRGLFPTGLEHGASAEPPRLRWVGDSGVEGGEPDVLERTLTAARDLAGATGARLHETGLSMEAPRFNEAFYAMMQADRYSTGGRALLADHDRRRLLTGYARHQFERASQLGAEAYSAAVEVQLQALEHMERLLDDADVVVTPTLGFVAPAIVPGELTVPEAARRGFVAFTFLMNFTGLPAITVPCGLVRGMPVGLQLIGRQHSEPMLLGLAAAFQERVHRLPPSPLAARVSAGAPTATNTGGQR